MIADIRRARWRLWRDFVRCFFGLYFAPRRGARRTRPLARFRRFLLLSCDAIGYARLLLSGTQIVWIVSVSKSGNTWLRYLLFGALYGDVRGTGQPELAIPHWGQALRNYLFGLAKRTRRHRYMLVKTHALPGDLRSGYMGFLMPLTAGVIYVQRNPKDVCLAQINHLRLAGMRDDESDVDLAFDFLDGKLFPKEGPWSAHIRTWERWNGVPYLRLRYEDMKNDPALALRQSLELLEEVVAPDRIARAVEKASFQAMQRLEDRDGTAFGYRRRDADRRYRFVNKGLSNQSIDHLGEGFARAFHQRFEDPMREMGYRVDCGEPIDEVRV
jgi:hypothetical protein